MLVITGGLGRDGGWGLLGGLGRFDYPETIWGLSVHLGWQAWARVVWVGPVWLGWAGPHWDRFLMSGPTREAKTFYTKTNCVILAVFQRTPHYLIHQQNQSKMISVSNTCPNLIDLFTCKTNWF